MNHAVYTAYMKKSRVFTDFVYLTSDSQYTYKERYSSWMLVTQSLIFQGYPLLTGRLIWVDSSAHTEPSLLGRWCVSTAMVY